MQDRRPLLPRLCACRPASAVCPSQSADRRDACQDRRVAAEERCMSVLSASPATAVAIPDTHRDLLMGSVHGILATMLPDGQPQASVVWVDFDGAHVLLNTTLERRKCRNMLTNPSVSLLVIDPQNTARWIEVRGRVVELRRADAGAHADMLTRRYTDKQHFYGDIYPMAQQEKETRVVAVVEPRKVSLDAIFK